MEQKQYLWKKYNFLLTYKNNLSSLFSFTSYIEKGKLNITLTDLCAPYGEKYNLVYSFNDIKREYGDEDLITFEQIETSILELLITYIGGLDADY